VNKIVTHTYLRTSFRIVSIFEPFKDQEYEGMGCH